MRYDARMERDAVDEIAAQWRKLMPSLDIRPMATIGRLGRVCAVGERLIEATLAEFGLAIGDFDVLAALRRSGAPHQLTPSHLYRTLMLTSGAMTNRLDRLEERRLVQRIADPNDRRGVLVCLTETGMSLVDQAVEAHVENEARLLAALTRAEQTTLDGLLRKLLASMEAELTTLSEARPDDAPAKRGQSASRAAPRKSPTKR